MNTVSFVILTDDQTETDRMWNAIVNSGGQESMCGWGKDRQGFSWQITARALLEATADPDRAAAKRVMSAMNSCVGANYSSQNSAAQNSIDNVMGSTVTNDQEYAGYII